MWLEPEEVAGFDAFTDLCAILAYRAATDEMSYEDILSTLLYVDKTQRALAFLCENLTTTTIDDEIEELS